jgi:hypothetical protein
MHEDVPREACPSSTGRGKYKYNVCFPGTNMSLICLITNVVWGSVCYLVAPADLSVQDVSGQLHPAGPSWHMIYQWSLWQSVKKCDRTTTGGSLVEQAKKRLHIQSMLALPTELECRLWLDSDKRTGQRIFPVCG